MARGGLGARDRTSCPSRGPSTPAPRSGELGRRAPEHVGLSHTFLGGSRCQAAPQTVTGRAGGAGVAGLRGRAARPRYLVEAPFHAEPGWDTAPCPPGASRGAEGSALPPPHPVAAPTSCRRDTHGGGCVEV